MCNNERRQSEDTLKGDRKTTNKVEQGVETQRQRRRGRWQNFRRHDGERTAAARGETYFFQDRFERLQKPNQRDPKQKIILIV